MDSENNDSVLRVIEEGCCVDQLAGVFMIKLLQRRVSSKSRNLYYKQTYIAAIVDVFIEKPRDHKSDVYVGYRKSVEAERILSPHNGNKERALPS